MKYFVFIVFLFYNCAFAQQANNAAIENSIKANFSIKVLEAYEENSFSKVEDFYELLEMYSDKNTSNTLKKQLEERIDALYKENTLVSDFFTSDRIPVNKLLEKIAFKGLKFEVKNIQKVKTFGNYWTASYILTIQRDTETLQKNISQRIYFYPEEKTFGNKKKEVWSLFLGEIE